MTLKKIEELRRRIAELRVQGQVSSRELEGLAEAVGRQKRKTGKHPMYVLKARPPLSIPHHSQPLKRRTKDSILTTLESDLATKEEELRNERTR